MKKPEYTYWSGLIIFLMSLAIQYLVGYRKLCLYVIMAAAVLGLGLSVWKKSENQTVQKIRMIYPAVLILLCLADLLMHREFLFFFVHLCAFAAGLFENVWLLIRNREVWKKAFPGEHVKYVFRCVLIVLTGAVYVILNVMNNDPAKAVRRMQEAGVNTMEYPAQTETVFNKLYRMEKDIVYGTEYPNSTFDLIYPEEGNNGLVIWMHGGGHIGGDKAAEDNSTALYKNCLWEGWAVASVNYALAPEYAYPVPLKQFDLFMQYITNHYLELGINLKRVFFAGTGAGAEILTQYAAASLYPEYAELTGFEPEIQKIPCGMYLASGLYAPAYGAETGLFLTDYPAYQQLRTYYGKKDLPLNQTALNADVFPYIRKGFPPVLLSDGNTGTYTSQAHRMKEVLEKAGSLYEALIFDENKDNKDLIYMSFDVQYNTYANAVHGRLMKFLETLSTK
ncbi:MAG: alpha/beta hydrolase [Solobacterium sp.]|nr:alpha/beta hydrolase [Solobacterium sp.]